MKCILIAVGLLAILSQPAFGRGGVIHLIHVSSSPSQEVVTLQRAINRQTSPRNHDRSFVAQEQLSKH
jgi:hypothetical protein